MTDKITEDDVVAALRKSLALDVRRQQIEWANDSEETPAQEAERLGAAADFRDIQQAYIQQFGGRGYRIVTQEYKTDGWPPHKVDGTGFLLLPDDDQGPQCIFLEDMVPIRPWAIHEDDDGTFYLRQSNGVRMMGTYATEAAAVLASKIDFDVLMGVADQYYIITEDMLEGREGNQDITHEQSKAFWDEISRKYCK